MTENTLVTIPFILNAASFSLDQAIIFLVGVLMAITVNAEAQAIMATALGDVQKQSSERFHFNPLYHLSLSGMLCFMVAGFGWARPVRIDENQLAHPSLHVVLIRAAGPLANLLLAGIGSSIIWLMGKWHQEDQVFTIVVVVNLMVVVYNLILLPPLAGASIVSIFLPDKLRHSSMARYFTRMSPYLIVAVFLVMRWQNVIGFRRYLDPLVISLFGFLTSP